ncbi:MAG TPA: sensor histidine kinase [Candidatus Limnocylindria bacterium]|nr:sensor histidine kinase [Candidatus Limnocylindria bacterium]
MTTPNYTSSPAAAAPDAIPAPRSWYDRVDTGIARLRASRRLLQTGLDVAGIGLVWLAFTSSLLSPELWFHGVFVVLTLHAFLFGLRGTLIRIGISSVPLLVYAEADTLGLNLAPLELTEWPLMFVIAGVVAWMADRREAISRRYAALFRQASERLLTVQEDERRRIARELHDGVGQVLTALTLTLDARPPESRDQAALAARALADTALAETRDLADRLRPARLDEIGLVPALRDLAKRAGFPVEIEASAAAAERDLLAPGVRVEVYRIVQEALANAARHSGASGARVAIDRGPRRFTVEVSDEGRGFDLLAISHVGIGLAGMQERTTLIGAALRIDSGPTTGTRLRLEVPLADAGQPA